LSCFDGQLDSFSPLQSPVSQAFGPADHGIDRAEPCSFEGATDDNYWSVNKISVISVNSVVKKSIDIDRGYKRREELQTITISHFEYLTQIVPLESTAALKTLLRRLFHDFVRSTYS